MTDRDDPGFDPSDWLAKQFGEPEEPETLGDGPTPSKAAPADPPPASTIPDPAVPLPTLGGSPAPEPPVAAGGFSWGLTPGSDSAATPGSPVPPVPSGAPEAPPGPELPPASPYSSSPITAPALPEQPVYPPTAALPPDATVFPAAPPLSPTDAPTTALEPAPWEAWQSRPLDPALDGMTEVIEAEIVGIDPPDGESNPTPGIDDLFGDGRFHDYGDEPIISGPPPAGPKPPRAAKGERAPVSRTQKVLLWVAGGLVAALALVALFLVGTRLPALLGPAPALTPSPTPTPSPSIVILPAGPLEPGEYQWDELLGGECLDPFESAWQDRYTVVDCATPHPAQMVARGRFEDAPGTPFPGAEELQKRINLLCTAASVINYQVAATAIDIQVTASFPVDEDDWDSGNRTYFCFVDRASGEKLTASVAIPQPAVTLTPAPVAP